MITARPTTYKGIAMRSRLEAAYAEYLDSGYQGRWSYEPKAFADQTGQYLPDFALETFGEITDYYEIKPDDPTIDRAAVLKRMHIILASEPDAGLIIEIGRYSTTGYTWALGGVCTKSHPCGRCPRVRPRKRRELTSSLLIQDQGHWKESLLICPQCDSDMTHLETWYQIRHDEDRPQVELSFKCEEGHEFVLRVMQHKGETLLETA